MDNSIVRWVHRKQADDDVYYDRVSRQVFRERSSAKIGDDEQVYSLATFDARAPLKVYFDLSYYCNLKCRHCITNSSTQADRASQLPTKRILGIIDELANIGVLEIMVGGGEPLCYPDLYSILKHMRMAGLNVQVSTNGTLITPSVANSLADIGLNEVRVSFDGGQQVHDSIRGLGTYQRALGAVAILSRTTVTVVPRLTLCSNSKLGLEQLFKDLASMGIKTIKVSDVKDAGRASLFENQELLNHSKRAATVMELRDIGKRYGIMVKFPVYFPITLEEVDGREMRSSKRKNCGAGIVTAYISPSGNVQPCSSMPRLIFGNLSTISFMDAWTSSEAATYRHLALSCGCCQLCACQSAYISSNPDTT